MVDLVEAPGAWVAVPSSSRSIAWSIKAKEMIDAGDLGQISHIQFRSMRPRQRRYKPWLSEWMYDREAAGGGVLINIGCHGVEGARYLTGEEPEVIAAVTSNAVDGLEVEEYALVTMRTPSSFTRATRGAWSLHCVITM